MKAKRTGIRILLLLFCLFLSPGMAISLKASQEKEDILQIAQGIVNWKKIDNGSTVDGILMNDSFLALAGTTPGDWFPIALGRLGLPDDTDAYLAVLREQVETRYREKNKLSAAKATEWHRISLAVLACGGDPTCFGTDENGNPINLIADGTYDRGKTASLGRQGINGWIWGLIALDSMRYEIPENSFYSRSDILVEIMRQQLSDGGFALSGKSADPDITAMALQALAPYYNEEQTYEYTQKKTGITQTKSVRMVVDEALACLSAMQLDSGDFSSWGTQNVESTDQVIVALCSLGVDPLTDERFIKNGNTLLDGVLRYRMPDGGFVHSYTADPDNPSSRPDQSNSMASEQTLYTMAALWRQAHGMRTLYDFRDEMGETMKNRILSLQDRIMKIGVDEDRDLLRELLTEFYALPKWERSYVQHYWVLSDAAKKAGIDVLALAETVTVVEDPDRQEPDTELLYFSPSDKKMVDSLPEELTTEYYVSVVKLLDKLEKSEDFDGKEAYFVRLTEAKQKIAAIQAEIDALNAAILEELYPFTDMSISNKKAVDAIVARYEALSEYDRASILYYEDVLKTKTKIDNLLRAWVISGVMIVIIGSLTVIVAVRIRHRRKKKQWEMEELAAQYKDES